MITVTYSVLHFMIDGICAFSMFGNFTKGNYEMFWIYNFCAFALQLPIGALLDMYTAKNRRNYSCCFALLGVCLTVIGAAAHPVILGIGNALFHVGAGVSVIREDYEQSWKGKALGIFVAPGALGLYLGTKLANIEMNNEAALLMAAVFAAGICAASWKKEPKQVQVLSDQRNNNGFSFLAVTCLVVVILRSYVGMAVQMEWKIGFAAGLLSVLAVVLGKMAGGIIAAKYGAKFTITSSLLAAGICYLMSDHMVGGILALFFFNMTMPITLYLLVDTYKGLPGFSFGLLTFGLFVGFIPVYLEFQAPFEGNLLGMAGSIASLVLLLLGIRSVEKKRWQ